MVYLHTLPSTYRYQYMYIDKMYPIHNVKFIDTIHIDIGEGTPLSMLFI